MARLALCVGLVVLTGCSGGNTAADSGTAQPDLTRRDSAPDRRVNRQDARPDQKRAPDTGRPDARLPAHWVTFQGPTQGRWSHTATLLKSGRVLIAGGQHKPLAVESLADAQLYVPPGTFQAAGSLAEARAFHAAVRLDDGRVLVVGGQGTGSKDLASTEIFDPAKPAAQAWSRGPDLFSSRTIPDAVKLADGRVVVVGGYNSSQKSLSSLELYDPKTGSVAVTAARMKEGRAGPTATLLASGKVLIAGGHAGNQVYPKTLELYDPQTGSISELSATLTQGRVSHTATLLKDGRVLIVGGYCGSSCTLQGDELYDPQQNRVTPLSHAGPPPQDHAACLLADGRLLVVGGSANEGTVVVAFNAAGGLWSKLPSLAEQRHDHRCTTLLDGSVLVMGGKDGAAGNWGNPAKLAERFVP